MDFYSLLPLLKIITSPDGQKLFLALVTILTFIVVTIRIRLRIDLGDLSSQVNKLINSKETSESSNHMIIKEVIKRSKSYKVIGNAERFNSSVIIDQVYSQNKLWILIPARRDSWDFICRSFPNVLISLGLLGTFVGITSNLGSIQDILKINVAPEQIIDRLQAPLNGMATAFGSSLIALFFGILLNIVNLIFNTTVAKYRFLSLLEDYLNNSIIFSDSTTDRLLNGIKDSLVSFRSEIVIAFETTIAQAIGNSFASQVSEIITENRRATTNLSEFVNHFKESSFTISNSTKSFEDAARLLSDSNLSDNISKFSLNMDKVSSVFEQTSISVANSTEQFQDSMQLLDTYTENFVELHQTINQLMEITQSNQENLMEALPAIKQEKQALLDTVDVTRDLLSNITTSIKKSDIQAKESELLQAQLVRLTKSINAVTEKITDKLYQGLDFDSLHNDNQQIIESLERLHQYSSSDVSQQVGQLISVINEISLQLANQSENLTKDNNDITGNPNLQVEGIDRIEGQIANLNRLINNINKQVTNLSKSIEENNQKSVFPSIFKMMGKSNK